VKEFFMCGVCVLIAKTLYNSRYSRMRGVGIKIENGTWKEKNIFN
jgi:hypothetical protein